MSTNTVDPPAIPMSPDDYATTVDVAAVSGYERQVPARCRRPWLGLRPDSRDAFRVPARRVIDDLLAAGFVIVPPGRLAGYVVEAMASLAEEDLDLHAARALAIVDESAVRDA